MYNQRVSVVGATVVGLVNMSLLGSYSKSLVGYLIRLDVVVAVAEIRTVNGRLG